MSLLNNPKDKKTVIADQTESSTASVTPPTEPNIEDMELNEEQLDIISGGAEIIFKP